MLYCVTVGVLQRPGRTLQIPRQSQLLILVASERMLVVTNGLDFPRFGAIVVPQQSCVRHSEEAGM